MFNRSVTACAFVVFDELSDKTCQQEFLKSSFATWFVSTLHKSKGCSVKFLPSGDSINDALTRLQCKKYKFQYVAYDFYFIHDVHYTIVYIHKRLLCVWGSLRNKFHLLPAIRLLVSIQYPHSIPSPHYKHKNIYLIPYHWTRSEWVTAQLSVIRNR